MRCLGDAAGHRVLGHEEGAGHLGRREPADGPQRERDLRLGLERGVAAHEQQHEAVIGVRSRRWGVRVEPEDRLLAAAPGLLGAQQVGEAAGGHGDEPRARVPRRVVRPLPRGGQQRLLHGVLGGVEVPVAAHHRAEDLRRQLAQQVLDRRHQKPSSPEDSTIGRTSAYAVAAISGGPGHSPRRNAIAVARSKLSHSTIQ